MTFIEEYLKYTYPAEGPESFFRWALHTAIGAVMRDNCWVNTTEGPIYPNLYTVLLSTKSSAVRKNLPMKLAYNLVKHIENTHIVSGRASLPGIVKVLTSMKTTSNGHQIKDASGFLFSRELTGLLHKDPDTIDQLTDWYDFAEELDIVLKGEMEASGGVLTLKNLCISLLGATNDANIPEFYTKRAQSGGLLARSVIVRESKRKHIKSYLEAETLGDFSYFEKTFEEFANLKGPITLDDNARAEHISWYNSITDEKISSTGIEGRIQTHALKVAMHCAIANRREQNIKIEDIQYGIDQCVKLLPNYKILSQTIAVSDNVKVGALFLRELLLAKDYTLSIKQLLQRLWVEGLDKEELDKILATYEEAGLIELGRDTAKQEIVITLTEVALEKYREKTGEKEI
ncbi:hypothetical protein LCGC14_1238300 [marine sediment metagenome]|uniref:Uncharacterized protein n=1 Tax=marine sediment metagenome TaxID=412755 RepID=A0A0F9PAS4_9ZZZZ